MIHFGGANVSECLTYDLLTFCEFIFGGPTWGPNGGLRSQVSGLRSQVSGLRSRVSGLRSQVSGLRSQVSGLRSRVSGLGSQVTNACHYRLNVVVVFLFIPISIGFPFETLHLINVSSTYVIFLYMPH